jgi:hypothetical protein
MARDESRSNPAVLARWPTSTSAVSSIPMRLGMSSSTATSSVPRIDIAEDGRPALASFVGIPAGPMPASPPTARSASVASVAGGRPDGSAPWRIRDGAVVRCALRRRRTMSDRHGRATRSSASRAPCSATSDTKSGFAALLARAFARTCVRCEIRATRDPIALARVLHLQRARARKSSLD